jgi:hypothetical protein
MTPGIAIGSEFLNLLSDCRKTRWYVGCRNQINLLSSPAKEFLKEPEIQDIGL